MAEFCEAVLKGKERYGWDFDWTFQTHASAKFDTETLALAKKAGCYMFSYGIESASPTVLKSMKKKTEPDQIVKAIELAKEAGIGFSGNLIFGDPSETSDTFVESLTFWMQKCKTAFVFLSNLMPYPGSAVFSVAKKKGFYKDRTEYYEHIDEVVPNLTTIREREYQGFVNMLQFLEKSWLFVEITEVKKMEQLDKEDALLLHHGGHYYKMQADCPVCGKEIEYIERLMDDVTPFWLGTGCVHCGSKIKVVKV